MGTFITQRYRQLEKYKGKVSQLEKELERTNRRLIGIPAKYGFRSMRDFIDALSATQQMESSQQTRGNGRRPRATITRGIIARVKALVLAGNTIEEVAAAVRISAPSVQNIKRRLGLINKRQ